MDKELAISMKSPTSKMFSAKSPISDEKMETDSPPKNIVMKSVSPVTKSPTQSFLNKTPTKKPAPVKKPSTSPTSEPKPLSQYPKGAFFCLGNEVAERFSYYSLKAIFVVYLMTVHKLEDYQAAFYYHMFVAVAYFSPLVGSFMADGALGVFRVIIIINTLYCMGQVILVVGAMLHVSDKQAVYVELVGFFVIAFGIGGIKPCISAFNSDQFPLTMTTERRRFGSIFYCSVTLTALIAEFVAPLLSRVNCFNQDTCYPLAFGVPGSFVFIAFFIFLCGIKYYRRPDYKDTTLCQVINCVCYAIGKNCCKCPRMDCLDVANKKYGEQLVNDVKSLLHIFLLFIPSIFFWALFDQQGSTWVQQASNMDGHFFGRFHLFPDQTELLNPLFMLILIPLFVYIIYPIVWKYDCLVRPLRRMGYGCFLATLSFVTAGLIQFYMINPTLVQLPIAHHYRYAIINFRECDISITGKSSYTSYSMHFSVPSDSYEIGDYLRMINFQEVCSNSSTLLKPWDETWIAPNITKGFGQVLIFFGDTPLFTTIKFKLEKTPKGRSIIHVAFHPDLANYNITVRFFQYEKEDRSLSVTSNTTKAEVEIIPWVFSSSWYNVILENCSNNECSKTTLLEDILLQNGGVYCLAIENENKFRFVVLITANTVSMAWMIPQYFLLTVGEIMFAMSGSELATGQAARSMRSSLHACWLTTKGLGNVVTMLISGTDIIENDAYEYFFYAGLMLFFLFVFMHFASNYTYIERQKIQLVRQGFEETKKVLVMTDFIEKLELKIADRKKQVFTDFIE